IVQSIKQLTDSQCGIHRRISCLTKMLVNSARMRVKHRSTDILWPIFVVDQSTQSQLKSTESQRCQTWLLFVDRSTPWLVV
ncbi:MAG: hypothetical protein MI717_03440, partial [Spirochaetales bacterium]|nr:hypothetical protein [Spirochaetales bacterium]